MMEFTGVKERLAEFDARHGASLRDGGRILFEDGALRELDPLGALWEPPSEPWDLARRILHYRKLVLDRAVEAFEERRQFYVKVATNNLNQKACGPAPADPETASAELKELRHVVRRAKRAYDAQLVAVDAAKPPRFRELEAESAANREANQALLSGLAGIEV